MEYRGFFDVPQPWENETGSRQTLHNKTARSGAGHLCGFNWWIDHPSRRRVQSPDLESRSKGLSFDKLELCIRHATLWVNRTRRTPIIRRFKRTECRSGWLTIRAPHKAFMNPLTDVDSCIDTAVLYTCSSRSLS